MKRVKKFVKNYKRNQQKKKKKQKFQKNKTNNWYSIQQINNQQQKNLQGILFNNKLNTLNNKHKSKLIC